MSTRVLRTRKPKVIESDESTPVKAPVKVESITDTPKIDDTPLKRKILRPRKEVNYHLNSADDTPDNAEDASDVGDSLIQSECDTEGSDSEFFSKKKRKLDNRSLDASLIKVLQSVGDSDDENEYKRQRQKNMEDRFKVLSTLEFDGDIKQLKSVAQSITPKSRPKSIKKEPKPLLSTNPTKRSLRLQNRSLNVSLDSSKADSELQFGTESLIKDEQSEKMIDEYLPFIDEGAEEDLTDVLKNLKNDMNVPYEYSDDFCSCDFEKYCEVVQSCQMIDSPIKIIKQRIVSLDVHPSQKKLIVIAGDKHGNVALRELSQETGIEFKAHAYNVNCVSFGKQDNTKFFSTSLDGTVRQGDVNSSNLQLIYSADSNVHTTWHHEFGHSLFVAEGHKVNSGDGVAKLIDLRAPSDECVSFKCHKRSIRTIQLHPTDENFFLTSSGTGEFCIWDIRLGNSKKQEPVIKQTFDKGLTSAFFSAKGTCVLTTGNDDTIRVYNVSNLTKAVQETKVSHNNHGGRWLSVFKARWHPQREDAFFVGSMMNNPNRIQIYRKNGKIIHQLVSSEMTTYNPVVVAHPTQPIFVGGNGSGRIHVFSPYSSLF